MYRAKSFESVYRLADFLNSNGVKPEDVVGIYRDNKFQSQGGFDLLYIEKDMKEVKYKPEREE